MRRYPNPPNPPRQKYADHFKKLKKQDCACFISAVDAPKRRIRAIQAAAYLGERAIARIKDNGLMLIFDWESHRKPKSERAAAIEVQKMTDAEIMMMLKSNKQRRYTWH